MVKYPYDALAAVTATVRMKDITSDARNRALLHRIKNNDPSLTELCIGYEDVEDFDFVIREGDDLGWLGYYIGENEILESLGVFNLRDQAEKFFIGLQRNKSIKEIELDGCASDSLSSINLPHVTTMTVDLNQDAELDCERAHHIAVGLQRCKSLVKYWGPIASEIVTSLATLPMLENVWLWREVRRCCDESRGMCGVMGFVRDCHQPETPTHQFHSRKRGADNFGGGTCI